MFLIIWKYMALYFALSQSYYSGLKAIQKFL